MIAIDWSHTKELATYDGKKSRTESLVTLLKRIGKTAEGESTANDQTTQASQPSVVIEQGCPLNLIYRLLLAGARVFTISNRATEDYRKEHNVAKTDETDAKIIYELASNGAKLTLIGLDNKLLQLHDAYHQYCRYQKARVALTLMKKAHERQYKGAESTVKSNSITAVQAPDLSPYDIAISTLEGREKSLIKRCGEIARGAPLFEIAEESRLPLNIFPFRSLPKIKGLGERLGLGILITANPLVFKCLSAYLRFCGLTADVKASGKYSRHARALYYLLADEIMKLRDPQFRPIYDKCKADIALNHPDYTKGHIHSAALNRTSTFLAKYIFSSVRGESKEMIQSPVLSQPRTLGKEER